MFCKIESAHVSRTVSWSATFLLVLASLAIGGCGVTVPGVTSKTSTAGSLSVSSTSLLFGAVTVGNTAAETVTVTNTGTAAIQVSQAQVTGQYFSLTGAAAPLTLAAGSSVTLTVDFAPKAAGAAAGTLALTTPGSTTSIGLSGNGTISEQPGLTLSTTSVAFGTATVNTAVTASVTMTSSGTAPLTISSATVTGSGFSLSGLALPLTLSPGQSASLTLNFDPANPGSFSGALTLATNTSQGSATIQMSGTGSTIQSILGDFTCDSDNLVGQGTENCSLTLNSPADTGGLTVGLSSSSTAVTVPSVMTVAAGTTTGSFSLSYFPVANAQTVTLTASTTNSHKQHNLNLGASSPGVKLNPGSVSFGNVMLNSVATQSVTVTSSGTAALTISAATVTGIGYGISGMALPLTLNPGQTANLTVSFDPTVAGSATGSVSLATNASTVNIALSGTGQSAGTLSALSCTSSSLTGAGSDACTVSLTGAAPSGGLAVSLSSSSGAVAVPSSVVVPAGASSVGFTATVSSVTTAQTATLTAQSGGVTATYAINLSPAATPVLSGVNCASSSMTGQGSDA
ncbi:MAG TPA: choice-of-anchor D domain-containing protein, partial [Acidobacteriaceae bacterium]|nr:choice-of-anchor D domain-containing protein [Acidobacteriaceae bacterium]